MKERIINFIKFKFLNCISFFNEKISLEARFTILATYIIITLSSLSYFLIILFFAFLYFYIWNLLKSRSDEIGKIFKTFIFEVLQFFAVIICYFLVTKLMPEADYTYFVTLIIVINIILLTSSNILAKRVSLILEFLCFIYLFLAISFIYISYSFSIRINFSELLNDIDSSVFVTEQLPHLPYKKLMNFKVILIMIINFIGFSIIFFKNKSYSERTKILLLLSLMLSFFAINIDAIFFYYYFISFAIVGLMIFCQKLKYLEALIIFIALSLVIFTGSLHSESDLFILAISLSRPIGVIYAVYETRAFLNSKLNMKKNFIFLLLFVFSFFL